jgi:hypothetical protein
MTVGEHRATLLLLLLLVSSLSGGSAVTEDLANAPFLPRVCRENCFTAHAGWLPHNLPQSPAERHEQYISAERGSDGTAASLHRSKLLTRAAASFLRDFDECRARQIATLGAGQLQNVRFLLCDLVGGLGLQVRTVRACARA